MSRKTVIIFRQVIVGCLAVVGLISIINYAILPRFREKPDVIRTFFSPNQQYKAVLFNWNGGGGISPYCIDSISVVPSALSDSNADNDDYTVYTGACHAVGNNDNAPKIKWLSDKQLEITFDSTLAAQGVNKTILRGYAAKGDIQIVHKGSKINKTANGN